MTRGGIFAIQDLATLSIPGDRSVSNFNKSASGESQNIMAEYVIESWKCQLENFWRVSNMDDQLYFWQLKDIWVLIPKAELDREGEHQRDDSPSWLPVDWRIFIKKCWYWLKPSGILSWMFTIHNILNITAHCEIQTSFLISDYTQNMRLLIRKKEQLSKFKIFV